MGYGTPEYAIKSQNYMKNLKEKRSKKKFDAKNFKSEIVSVKKEKDPMIMFPQLPDNWVRPTATGNASYDDSVNEINNKLKRTIVRFKFLFFLSWDSIVSYLYNLILII